MKVQFFCSDFILMMKMFSCYPDAMIEEFGSDPCYLVRFDLDDPKVEVAYGSDQWEVPADIDTTKPPRIPSKISL